MFTWLATKTAKTNNRATRHTITAAAAFAGCTRRQRAELERLSAALPVTAGTRLSIEGARRSELVVLLDGSATVYVGDETVGTLAPGDHFGEAGVLAAAHEPVHVQPVTIVADTDQWVAAMKPAQVRALLGRFPELAANLHRRGQVRPAGDHVDDRARGEVGGLLPSSAV